ncbi:hypothetical protein B296_00008174 [Ensete ventricosum]|uniref:Uncharacterized protein n=1 Tax=Ensete ventricosum TaxID=4639 RepID=A0A427BB77_ENSVE|nr:hypothetical protein B296_00008174 [Ensete ventricosum]
MLVLRFRNPSSYLLINYEYYGPTVVAGVTRVAHDRVNCRFMSRQTSGIGQRAPMPRSAVSKAQSGVRHPSLGYTPWVFSPRCTAREHVALA